MLDYGEDPPFLVLEHLDDDALRLSGEGKLSRSDIKSIARNTLRALSSLHAKGIAHTGKFDLSIRLMYHNLNLCPQKTSNRTIFSST